MLNDPVPDAAAAEWDEREQVVTYHNYFACIQEFVMACIWANIYRNTHVMFEMHLSTFCDVEMGI